MATSLSANIGVTGLADVGYRFIDATGAYTGSRITSGVVETAGAAGVYFVSAPTFPAGAVAVFWNSTGTSTAYATEVFDFRVPNVETATAGALITAGTGAAQLSVTSGVAQADAAKIGGQTASASGTITFPNATLASTTNITAGTITTTTNLTNAPTAGDFTATMKASIGTAVAASAVASVTAAVTVGAINTDAISAAAISAAAVTKIQSGLSTYSGGDTSGTTTLLARLTSTRAGYIDNLSGGAVMLASSYSAPPSAATIAAAVEAAILNEGDATALLAAIAAKVEAFLINDGDASATLAAIAAACSAAVTAAHGSGSYIRNTEPDNTGISTAASLADSASGSASAAQAAAVAATASADAATAAVVALTGIVGMPAGASVSADIAAANTSATAAATNANAAQVSSAAIAVTLGTPAGASIAADIANISGGSSGGSGAYPITMTFVDSLAAAIPGLVVRVHQGITDNVLTTNGSGVVTFNLDAGTWTFATTKSGYSTLTGSGTVTGSETGTLVATRTVSASATSGSTDPARCTVTGTFKYGNGAPAVGEIIEATLVTQGSTAATGGEGVVLTRVDITLDNTGSIPAATDLLRTDQTTNTTARWQFVNSAMKLNKKGVHLDGSSFLLTTLL